MNVVNNKIYFDLLVESEQDQKTIFTPNADMMKYALVLDVGHKVEWVKKGDVIKLYVNTMFMTEKGKGFCAERDVIFCNQIPQKGKVHIKEQTKDKITSLKTAKVINANCDDIQTDDIIAYRDGQSLILPDNTEIVSETQIYYTKG